MLRDNTTSLLHYEDVPISIGFLLAFTLCYAASKSVILLGLLPALLLYIALTLFTAVGLVMLRYLAPYLFLPIEEKVVVYAVETLLLTITAIWYPITSIIIVLIVLTLFVNALIPYLKGYTTLGAYFMFASLGTVFINTIWCLWYFMSIDVSFTTRLFLITTVAVLIFKLPSNILQFFESFDILCRHTWQRPRHALQPSDGYEPKVVLQIPTYAEPPELVIETLTVLTKLDYKNYEVWVIDNNTKDEALWRPVEAYCCTLGDRFHFIHVDNLKGAKAGALNYLNRHHTPADTEIMAVIDADYHTRTDFLSSLVGYFRDSKLGFIQTPHDYRDWETSTYLRACYYEYKLFFYTTMTALSERDTALTVGTMCLIRAEALAAAGGWSEWCVTEDSELSVRIHAAGYSGIYLTESFGQGLIPETFATYKKQRYRWTAGPVQEFFSHFAMLWPWQQKPNSELSYIQRLYHFHHGFNNVMVGMNIPLLLTAIGTIISMAWHREIIPVPTELFLAATVMLISKIMLDLFIYRYVIGANILDTLRAITAKSALAHVTSVAAFKTAINHNTPWIRTNKFKEESPLLKVLYSIKNETYIGITFLLLVALVFWYMPYRGLLLMFLIGISYKAAGYLCAVFMGYLEYTTANRNIASS